MKGKLTNRQILESLSKSDSDYCMPWPRYVVPHGYGMGGGLQPDRYTHRAMCRMVNGDPPEGRNDAAHSCGNRDCINPKHLRWASRKENFDDMWDHGTRMIGEKASSAKLTEANVRAIRASNETTIVLGKRYGVVRHAIGDIRRGRTWKHVT